MRSALILVCIIFIYLPTQSHARSAMNRCYEDHATRPDIMFSCMNAQYIKREDARKIIEEEIINIAHKNEGQHYNSVRREEDLEALVEGRKLFEDYRKRECDRQKTFLARRGPEATFSHMVCLYDMTTQRIRLLQNSVK